MGSPAQSAPAALPFPSHLWGIAAVQRALGSFPGDLLLLYRDYLLEFLTQSRAQFLSGQITPELISSVQRMGLRVWRTFPSWFALCRCPGPSPHQLQDLGGEFSACGDRLCVDPNPNPAQLWGLRCGEGRGEGGNGIRCL